MTKRRNRFDTESIIDYPPMVTSLPTRSSPVVGRRDSPQGQVGGRESDVTVPVLQSLAVSLAYASLASVLAGGVAMVYHLPWYTPAVAAALVLTATASWTMTKNVNLRQELWWGTEEVIQRDLDNDGIIGKPEPEALLRVEVANGGNTQFLDVPTKKAITFARAVVNGQSGMSEGEWKKPFGGIEKFVAFRNQLIERKLARWKNPDAHPQGIELTLAGKKVFERLANYSPTEH